MSYSNNIIATSIITFLISAFFYIMPNLHTSPIGHNINKILKCSLNGYKQIAFVLTIIGTLSIIIGIAIRLIILERPTLGNMYEFSISFIALLNIDFILFFKKYNIGFLINILSIFFLTISIAYLNNGHNIQLTPALKNYWLSIHVTLAIISVSFFTIGAILSFLFLIYNNKQINKLLSSIPRNNIDILANKINCYIFPIWTLTIITGALWAENAWGTYWNWDPKETWSFITWIIYAIYLHGSIMVNWSSKRLATYSIIGFLTCLFNFFAINTIFSGLHSYAGI